MKTAHPIIPREKLDFGLDGDIPKYWFGGDPFKTRLFDAMSTIFPEGERFFISCVRDYRDQVTDPELAQEIKDFIRQEGQHGIVHTQFNDRLKAQGIDVDRLENLLRFVLFKLSRRFVPKAQTLAETAATEHMTAIMAQADSRIRAMYAWHAMEEVEHKAVAFDVMQKVAKVGYLRRVNALIGVTLGFNLYSLCVTSYMLKVDGFGFWQRAKLMTHGAWWVYKPGGLYMSIFTHYIAYLKPSYDAWREAFDSTGDPILAGEVVYQAAGMERIKPVIATEPA